MKVKKAFNTTTTAVTTNVDLEANFYPFCNDIQAYVKHNQTGGTKGVKIYGRLHPSLNWILLNNITNTNETDGTPAGTGKYYNLTPCAFYRFELNNAGGGSMTAAAYLMR